MRIGIDASALAKPNPTGVEIVAHELIQALVLANQQDEIVLYSPTPIPAALRTSKVIERILPAVPRWTQTALGPAADADNLDVFWSPSYMQPLLLKTPAITTVHGLEFYKHPKNYKWQAWLTGLVTVLLAKYRSVHVTTVSNQVKSDLVKYFGLSPDKISVIPNAISPKLQHKILIAAKKPAEPYILAVGRIEPRKNIHRLVAAFAELATRHPKLRLTLAGSYGTGPYIQHIKQSIANHGLSNRVDMLGYVDESQLGALYKNASVVSFATIDEGFGIPVLEAFAADVPLVTSRTSAAAEVAEDAALLVDPNNVEEIARAIEQLLTTPQLASDLVQRGRKRLAHFSWDKSARHLIDIFHLYG